MSFIQRHVVDVVTDASGDSVVYSPRVNGKISAIHYVKHGSNAFADTVDFTIVSEATGETIWTESNVTASKTCYPRAAMHTTAGVAALLAAGGEALRDKIAVADDRVKITIAQGGDAKNGQFLLVVE